MIEESLDLMEHLVLMDHKLGATIEFLFFSNVSMLTQRVRKVKLEKRGKEEEEERKYKQLMMF